MRTARRAGPLLAALAAALGAGVLPAAPAAAHATLVDARPADGSVVAAPLDQVRLTFDTAVSPDIVTVVVAGPGGTRLHTGTVTVADRQVSVALQPSARRPGRYRVAYRAVGPDGRPVSGELRFGLAGPAGGSAGGAAATANANSVAAPGEPAAGDAPWRTHLLHIVIGVVIVGAGGWLLVGMRRT